MEVGGLFAVPTWHLFIRRNPGFILFIMPSLGPTLLPGPALPLAPWGGVVDNARLCDRHLFSSGLLSRASSVGGVPIVHSPFFLCHRQFHCPSILPFNHGASWIYSAI